MPHENRIEQINAAISTLSNAKVSKRLVEAQSEALALIKAAYEMSEIDLIKKKSLEKKVRRIYRNQLIHEGN